MNNAINFDSVVVIDLLVHLLDEENENEFFCYFFRKDKDTQRKKQLV